MGSAASSRAKAQAKASKSSSGSDAGTSGGAIPVTNAGGDIESSHHSLSMSEKRTLTDELEDVDGSSTSEDGSSRGDTDIKSKSSTENAAGLGEGDLQPIKSDQESAKKGAAMSCMRDVACQIDCKADEPDDAIITNLDELPQYRQPVYFHHNLPRNHGVHVHAANNHVHFCNTELPGSQILSTSTLVNDGISALPQTCEGTSHTQDKVISEALLHKQQQYSGSFCEGMCPVGDHHKTPVVFPAKHQQTDDASAAPMTSSKPQRPQQAVTISASFLSADDDQPRRMPPSEGAFRVVSKGLLPPLEDYKPALVPNHRQQQQHRSTTLECALPFGMEGMEAAVSDPQQNASPVGDVAICEGPCPKVINVGHDEDGDSSDNLPPVTN